VNPLGIETRLDANLKSSLKGEGRDLDIVIYWWAFQYNGCKWKGGSLRVEKAKEHYMDRLRCEWAAAQAKETSNEDYLNAVPNTLGGDAMNKQSKLSITNLSFMQSEPLKIAMASSKKVCLSSCSDTINHWYCELQ
jgi:hypothetical protein